MWAVNHLTVLGGVKPDLDFFFSLEELVMDFQNNYPIYCLSRESIFALCVSNITSIFHTQGRKHLNGGKRMKNDV